MTPIRFTRHALDRLEEQREFGFAIDEDTVLNILMRPEVVLPGHSGRTIAESSIDESHVLRVVFEASEEEIVVVTLYPTRREWYEI